MRVLVTGAGGFVGNYLVPVLKGAGHEVTGAAHKPFTAPAGVATEIFDVRDRGSVVRVLSERPPEGVVHLAAQASVPRSWEDPATTFEVNLIGMGNLIAELSDSVRVVLVGSAQVYGGALTAGVLGEDSDLRPESPYAVSKAAAEMLGEMHHAMRGLPVMRTRSFNHTGPGQSTEYVVSAFCSRIAALEAKGGGRLEVGRLDAVRDFLDVRDVVEAYRVILERGEAGEVYNVCSGLGVTAGDILKSLLEGAQLEGAVEVVEDIPPRHGDPDVLIGDNSKIRSLGWAPRFTLEQTLADTLNYHRRKERL